MQRKQYAWRTCAGIEKPLSRKYKFKNNDKLYFVAFSVVYWINLFKGLLDRYEASYIVDALLLLQSVSFPNDRIRDSLENIVVNYGE